MSTEAVASTSTTTWTGEGLTQEDFMHKDECILVDDDDRIVGGSPYLDHMHGVAEVEGPGAFLSPSCLAYPPAYDAWALSPYW